ncbi:MAG: hypothetical protein SFW66_08890 [Gammaproteobacteria bacterium]|nr:hypothetical protein [Gammaproteobacteria bacterium]
MDFPITLIRKIFKSIDAYYKGHSEHIDAYQHFWSGFLIVLISCLMPIKFGIAFCILGFFIYVVLKEIIYDIFFKKKKFNKIDLILRISGFLFSAPFLGIKIWL